ncbi:putative 28S rRNA (cytosine-C(5))-methyltransferase [Microtus ochrogaster]|uniref:Putative 28S rRNA (Cytosine-C(5))-methyltransferase n=1 Tax=Microtus ochrogaster TaxID=79684 RepID=A0A8J6GLQ7_MICOH|nr:putative 28S rRNA (cytosine-C(5))-methyltransferase [Microtus ochrogaster]
MLDPSELEFFTQENMEEISQLASLEMLGDVVATKKSSTIVSEKPSYPDSVYVMAANIFQSIRVEKSPDRAIIKYGNEPLPSWSQSEDEAFQRSSYELAFSTLKYQDILETILIDSTIFPSTTIPDHLSSLIIVMLYDFQDRKFQPRAFPSNEESISEVQEVETLLNSCKRKLAASLARCRIKHDALSIYHILPETIRKQEQRASTLPLYAWINTDIEILYETFVSIEPKDPRLQNVKVILLLPRCSGQGVSNPVEFILNEHGDTGLLQDLSQGGPTKSKLEILAQQQYEQLEHAMRFAKVQAIVYCTCSVYAEENEAVVMKALECQNQGIKIQPYRLSPPVLPLCSLKEMQLSVDKFFRLEPSDVTNGCFLSILTRERDPSETVSVKDVLARAAAKGLLDGVELGKTSKREKKRKKSKTSLSKAPTNDNNDIQMKITELISQESKASTSRGEALTKTPLPPKTGSQGGASSQVRKPKPGTNSLLTTMMKTTYSSRPEDRQVTLRRRPEGKVIPLKAVEIVLPPVMFPLSSSQGPRAQMPANRVYYRLVGSKVGTHSYVTPPATRRVEKAKESTPSSCVRHPRPWL